MAIDKRGRIATLLLPARANAARPPFGQVWIDADSIENTFPKIPWALNQAHELSTKRKKHASRNR